MGIVFQSWWPSIPAQVFQVAPFPLMIFMLVLIHLSRGQRMGQFLEAHPVFRPIIRFLQANPPASLGETYHKE
jgi:simple sugar transport system permease protein